MSRPSLFEQPDEAPKAAPCAACAAPAGFEVWGHGLCADCVAAWWSTGIGKREPEKAEAATAEWVAGRKAGARR
jgi:hypothetical protein